MSAVASAVPEFSFSDKLLDLLENADFRRADTDDEREAIFRLRYDAYVAEGNISPTFAHRFTDPYDETGNAWIFGIHLDGRLVSSIRLHVANKDFPDMPSLNVFPDFLERELEAGKIIIDPTRHAVDRVAMHQYPHLVYLTMRLGWAAAEYFQAETVLAAVRSEHQAFYKRVFGHRLVCPARPYPLLAKPISLMMLDYFEQRDRVNRRQPFFRTSFFERRMLFERLQETVVPAMAPAIAAHHLPIVPSQTHAMPAALHG
jgi:N-acyl-L-homoserine lactone synthetase